MKRLLKLCISALLVLAVVLSGCAAKEETPKAPEAAQAPGADVTAESAADEETVPVGIMSAFTTTDLEGNEVTAQSAFGDYTLTMVNVWGTFCGPCISEMPDLGLLSEELAEKNIRVAGIVTDALAQDGTIDPDIVEAAKEIVGKTGANYLHLLPSQDLMGLLYQIQAVPTTFFVDENGCQVGMAYTGAREKDEWLAIIEETLKEMQ